MAASVHLSRRLALLCALLVVILTFHLIDAKENVRVITTEDFSEMMQGEWMLEFYAPWCPACKQFARTWEEFGTWAEETAEVKVGVGKVDVTAQTLLSGQFMVTQLPSVFHIKDGAVRVYAGQRTLTRLIEYVEEEQWREMDPIPWWRSPTATHMRVMGLSFWLAEKAKEVQNFLEQDYKIPTYAVFIIIALGTILVGLTLGGITVCCIEICMRLCTKNQPPRQVPQRPSKPKQLEKDQPEEERQTGEQQLGERQTGEQQEGEQQKGEQQKGERQEGERQKEERQEDKIAPGDSANGSRRQEDEVKGTKQNQPRKRKKKATKQEVTTE